MKFSMWWAGARESLWFVPTILTVMAAGLAALTVWIDGLLLADGRVDIYLAFGGGAEGARGVLSAIAGSLVTVTGVVFSITIVALQLASSQFSPRVLRSFTGDRANQVVLGAFIATFTYTLLVLRTVRSEGDHAQVFVPSVSVSIAIVFALVSIGFLIFYIHHAARSIQASVIIDRVTQDTRSLIERLFPDPVGEAAELRSRIALPSTPSSIVRATNAGYLQVVDAEALFGLAERAHLTIRMEPRIGDFVLPGAPLASIWAEPPSDGAERPSDGAAGESEDDRETAARQAFVLGLERTLQHDVEFGIRQLTDIALKALSPGINDPTTAMSCIDRLAEIIVLLGNRREPDSVRAGEEGRVCFIANTSSFERAVALGFDQIRHYGLADASVASYLLMTLGRVAALVPPERRASLLEQADAALSAAQRLIDEPMDLRRVERAYATVGLITVSSD